VTQSAPIQPDSSTNRAEGVVQIIIMLAIGGAAGAASFTHVHNVAAAHGQGGWLAWADAVVLELMSIASGLELRRRKRQHKSVCFPAAVMGCAVALSISAQVVEAELSVIGWLAAALPALGFLVMVKIAIGRTSPTQAGNSPEARSAITAMMDETSGNTPAASPDGGVADPVVATSGSRDAAASREGGPQDRQEGIESGSPKESYVPGPADFDDVAHLLPAATAAYRALARQGQALTHKSLTGRLRADGHAVSNARAARLLKILKEKDGDH
jgi:hypothetical protein